VRKVALTVKC